MIIKTNVITDLNISSLKDLYKLKPFLEDSTLKINKSQIARELQVDRRTVDKYIKGYEKPSTRSRNNCISPFYDIIKELLSESSSQIFYYRKVLWNYLRDNHGYKGEYCNFCSSLKKYPEFEGYFKKRRDTGTGRPIIRYETDKGKQAQIDWKENIPFLMEDGEEITVNIFVILLSYSRYRIYRVSVSKTQDILFSFLDDAFETLGGVPSEIVTDNMRTVMDEARTEHFKGKVNNRFRQFADDYGFKVIPCIAGRPQTKAKVEAPMKVLDEIRAYNGRLDYRGLVSLVERINNRANTQVNQGTGRIPIMYLAKEKDALGKLPPDAIRKPYRLAGSTSKVNASGMFTCGGCQYSAPPEYIGKVLQLQSYDGYIHAYYKARLVTIHPQGTGKLNYHPEHYIDIVRKAGVFRDEEIETRARENLDIIGRVYSEG